MARLDEICRLNMGQSPDSSSYNEIGDGLPFFQGNADFGELHPKMRIWCNAPTKIAHPGDILISVRAPIGALNIADRECCIGRGLAALTVNEALCNSGYLWYAITNKVDELNSKGTGSTFKAISKNVLGETEIPLPSLDRQQQVSATLDKLTDLISLRKQQLTKLDEVVKARFVEMFGDPITNSKCLATRELIQIITLQRGYDLPVHSRDSSGNIPVYGSNGVLDYHSQNKSTCGVITGRSGTIGKVYYCKEKFWPLNTTLFSIETYGNSIIFLAHLLEYYKLDRFHDGTGVPTLNRNVIHRQPIIDVPVSQQEIFAAFVEEVSRQKLTIQQSLDKLEVLRRSLMQEYFG